MTEAAPAGPLKENEIASWPRVVIFGTAAFLSPIALTYLWRVILSDSTTLEGAPAFLALFATYFLPAWFLTRLARVRTIMLGILVAFLAVTSTLLFSEQPIGILLVIIAALTGGGFGGRRSARRLPNGGIIVLLGLGLVGSSGVFALAHTTPEEAALVGRGPDATVIATFNHRAFRRLVLVDTGRNPESFLVVVVRKRPLGYWSTESVEDPARLFMSGDVGGADEAFNLLINCGESRPLTEIVAACHYSTFDVIAGIAPRNATVVEVTTFSGKMTRSSIARKDRRGYFIKVPDGGGVEGVPLRASFYDRRHQLLDARYAYPYYQIWEDVRSIAFDCLGKDLLARCSGVHNHPGLAVSVSLLTGEEFRQHCHTRPPAGRFVLVVSVFDGRPRVDLQPFTPWDRRLFGKQVMRLAIGMDAINLGTENPVIRLPSAQEPCFPGPENAYG